MRHRVVQVGLGVRGKFHLRGLVENPEAYEIVGLCDLDPKKIEEAKAMFGLDVPAFTDAETMLRQTRPEVFVFVTHPNVRTQMVELAVRYGVKVLSFEKPMAMNLGEAHHIIPALQRQPYQGGRQPSAEIRRADAEGLCARSGRTDR